MKRYVLFCVLVLVAGSLTASDDKPDTVVIDAPIEEVTVFYRQAKVTRSVSIELEAGEHVGLIKELPFAVHEASLRASAVGATILGLQHSVERHTEAPQEKIAELERQIALVETQEHRAIQDRLLAFEEQKRLLAALRENAGKEMSRQIEAGGLDVTQWQAAFSFVGEKMKEVGDSLRVANPQRDSCEKKIAKLYGDLREITSDCTRQTRTVQISLNVEEAAEVTITLEYVVQGATWKPLYDARIVGDNEHVQLICYAEVLQNTGEDWEDVELTLSTANPSRGTGPGELPDWNLSIRDSGLLDYPYRERIQLADATRADLTLDDLRWKPVQDFEDLLEQIAWVETMSSGEVFIRGGRASEVAYIVDGVPISDPLGGVVYDLGGDISVSEDDAIEVGKVVNISPILGMASLTSTFEVERKETVPSGSRSVRTTIAEWELVAKAEYYSIPRNRVGAYRLVTITNQKDAPLLPGVVSIFAGPDYLGNAKLTDLVAPGEEFELPFGQDHGIAVKREILDYKKDVKGKKIKIEQMVKITLVNHHSAVRQIKVEEPLPVSEDSRIKVKLGSVEPKPDVTDARDKAEWTVTVDPGEEQVVLVPYKVEFPRDLEIVGL